VKKTLYTTLRRSCYKILSRCHLNVFTTADASADDKELGYINGVIGLDRIVKPEPELLLIVLAIWSQY
jgi:hypothetical protein